jgi:radical SAM superfamily enzyme YgiQ (UPF0313 family)
MISYGLESYCDIVLKSMRKGTNPIQIQTAIEDTVRAGLQVDGNFIIGDPIETSETANTTISYWTQVQQFGVNLDTVKPYPGTDLYKEAIATGIITNKLDYHARQYSESLNLTRMSRGEYQRLVVSMWRKKILCRKYTYPMSVYKRSRETDFVLRCPECGKWTKLRNYLIADPLFFSIPRTCKNCNRVYSVVSRLYFAISLAAVIFSYILPSQVSERLLRRFLPI